MSLARCLAALAAGSLVWTAAQADPDADYGTALRSYQEGDVVGAMPGLRKAAAAGHAKAQVLLAEILDRSEFDEEALALYRTAAEKGETDGMFGLATMLAAGEGLKEKDPVAARGWFEKAAELGHRQAVGVMAQAYLRGELGVAPGEQDSPAARRWIELAAEQDYLPAVDALASAYRGGGRLGLDANPALATRFQNQADRLRGIDPSKSRKKGRKAAGSSEVKE